MSGRLAAAGSAPPGEASSREARAADPEPLPGATEAAARGEVDVEDVLLRARGLLDRVLRENPEWQPGTRTGVDRFPGPDALWAAAGRLLPDARHEVLFAAPDRWWHQGEQLAATRATLSGLLSTGVRVRMMIDRRTLDRVEDLRRYLRAMSLPGLRIRVATAVLHEAVIIDGRTAFLRAGHGPADQQCVEVSMHAILRSLRMLFAAAWDSALDLGAYVQGRDSCVSETTTQILECLSIGYKDDTGARELGLSVRTYRRHVAAIMRGLKADSRFQAGVRAAELGLIAQTRHAPAS